MTLSVRRARRLRPIATQIAAAQRDLFALVDRAYAPSEQARRMAPFIAQRHGVDTARIQGAAVRRSDRLWWARTR